MLYKFNSNVADIFTCREMILFFVVKEPQKIKLPLNPLLTHFLSSSLGK